MPLDPFTKSYIETALWSSTDDQGEPLDGNYSIADISKECLDKMVEDCKTFQEANEKWIGKRYCKKYSETPEIRAGHDFWLTRCGHGAGFWDGDWTEKAGEALTESSKSYGNVDLYIGDDGMVYC